MDLLKKLLISLQFSSERVFGAQRMHLLILFVKGMVI